MKRFILLACCASMSWGVEAGALYRWVDAAGKVHYSDTPPPGTVQVEARKLSNSVTTNEYLPYETRLAQQNFPVTLYVADGCGEPCDLARNLLVKRGIPFSEKLLRTQEEVENFKKLSGADNAPALSVGKNFLSGFLAGRWHDELSIAGYPKTAPYRAPGDTGTPSVAASQVAPSNPSAR